MPAPEEKTLPPEPPVQKKEKPVPPPVPAAAAKEPVKAGAEKLAEAPAGTGQKKPVPKQTMIIAGIVILLLLGAAAYFVVLPMLSGSGGTPGGTVQPGLPSLPSLTQNQPGVQPSAVVTSAPSVSFETLPTQIPPADLLVTFQADRDPITGIVTITFTGGGGRYGVKNVDIRLTRSDGQVDTRTVTIDQIGNGMTLQGTKTGDDRIEIVANYFNGKQFRIIDKILEYKKRNW
jgi:hypothetical protein